MSDAAGGQAAHDSGWQAVATAIHEAHTRARPGIVHVEFVGLGPLDLDIEARRASWLDAPEHFPIAPIVTAIEQRHELASEARFHVDSAAHVDALLWQIGANAFGDEPADWLSSGERHRVTRWPVLTELALDGDELRMVALQGLVPANAYEIAMMAEVPIARANRVVNALAVMGILDGVGSVGPCVEAVAERRAAHRAPGPFGRLLEWMRS